MGISDDSLLLGLLFGLHLVELFLRHRDALCLAQVEHFGRHTQLERSVRILLVLLLGHVHRGVEFVHGDVRVDHALLVPDPQANVDLVRVLQQDLVVERGFRELPRFERGLKPAFEPAHLGLVVGREPELKRLIRVPEFLHCGPLSLALVEWPLKVALRLIVLILSVQTVVVVRLLVLEESVAVEVIVLKVILASAEKAI